MKNLQRTALSLAGLLLGACSPSPVEQLALAQQDFARQNYHSARILLGRALKEEPGNRAMLLLQAQTLLRVGDGEAALGVVERLKRAGLAPALLATIEAEAHLLRGHPESALRLLGADRSSDGWRVRAAALLMLGREAEALAAFRTGLAPGRDARLAGDYARFLISTGDYPEAERQLELMQRTRPQAIETLMLAGALAEARGDTAEAMRTYRTAARRYPWLAAPLVAQANLKDLEGQLDQAAQLAEVAASIQPDDSSIVDLKLSIYSQQGKWALIRRMLQPRERMLDPASGTGMLYAEALLRLEHSEHARAILSQAVIKAPNNRYARMMLGEAQLATGDSRAALATLRPLVEGVFVYPRELELAERAATMQDDPLAGRLRADRESGAARQRTALIEQGLAATAVSDWSAALRIWRQLQGYGEDAELLRRIADSASMVGQHELACASADKALGYQPGNAELLHLAGRVRLAGRRDLAKASELLAAATAREPANAHFRADLARAQSLTARGSEAL